MTSTDLDRFFTGARSLTRDAQAAATTAVAGGEAFKAAGDVIAARLEILAKGLADPSRADVSEIALMSSEKVEALSASAASVTRTLGVLGQTLTRDTADEFKRAGEAVASLSTAKTPEVFFKGQYDYALGWWTRAAGRMLTLNTELVRAQAAALKPIHDTAVANARRLKR